MHRQLSMRCATADPGRVALPWISGNGLAGVGPADQNGRHDLAGEAELAVVG